MQMDENDNNIDAAVFRVVFCPNRGDFYSFTVEEHGLMLEKIDKHIRDLLTDDEELEITRHPTKKSWEPALRFPCSLTELQRFLEWVGYGELDDEDLADLESATKSRTMAVGILSASSQAEAGKPAPRQDGRVTNKRENQIQAIEKAARDLGFSDPLKIPTGGRAAIMAHCIAWPEFGHSENAFDRAWRKADDQGRIRLAEKEKFMSKQMGHQ